MIVIEGRVQKSLILQALLKGIDQSNYIVINAIKDFYLDGGWQIDLSGLTHEEIIEWLGVSTNKYISDESKLLILEVNVPKEKLLEYFKVVDSLCFDQCIITVQNNNLKDNIIYVL